MNDDKSLYILELGLMLFSVVEYYNVFWHLITSQYTTV